MNEIPKIEQKPDNEAELIAFFEARGYKDIKLIPHRGRNDILEASKDGKKCFIKKFHPYDRSGEDNTAKTKNETLCYQNLPQDILINAVEINTNDGYIALENVNFDEIVEDEKYIEEIADFQLSKFPNIDASFLPPATWETYEKIFQKLRQLQQAGIIDNAESIIQIFNTKKDLIMNAPQIFTMQDFNRSNIKKIDGQIKIFDFEESRQQDNAMVDMATMSIDLRSKENLHTAYKEKIQASDLYDEELFNLMTVRRAVIVMYAKLEKIKSNQIDEFTQNNIDAFHEAIDKLKS